MTHNQCMARLERGSHRLAWLRELDRLLAVARQDVSKKITRMLNRKRRQRPMKSIDKVSARASTRAALKHCHDVLGPLSEDDYKILWLRDPYFRGSRAWRS